METSNGTSPTVLVEHHLNLDFPEGFNELKKLRMKFKKMKENTILSRINRMFGR